MTPIISVGDTSVRGYKFESIPDGISFTRNGQEHDGRLRQPRDVARARSRPTGSDFTNSLVSRLTAEPAQRRRAARRATRSRLESELPALLLELPRRSGSRGSSGSSCSRTRRRGTWVLRKGYAWHAAVRLARRAVRRAGRRRGRARTSRAAPHRSIYGNGAAQPRERRRHSRLRPSRRALGRRHVRRVRHRSSTCTRLRAARRCGTKRATLYAFVADDPNVNDYGDFPAANGASGHFIPVPRDDRERQAGPTEPTSRAVDFGYPAPPLRHSRRAAVGARVLEPQRRTRAPVHPHRGHRLRPQRRRTSSISPTPASRERYRTAPAGSGEGDRARAACIQRAHLQDGARPE